MLPNNTEFVPIQHPDTDNDNHLVITWNHSKEKFQVNVLGEATLVEALGLLELAKLELVDNTKRKEEQENFKIRSREDETNVEESESE